MQLPVSNIQCVIHQQSPGQLFAEMNQGAALMKNKFTFRYLWISFRRGGGK